MMNPARRTMQGAMFVAALLAATPAFAALSAEELAKLAQNPVGNLISLPFQNNTNLNFGPEDSATSTRESTWGNCS